MDDETFMESKRTQKEPLVNFPLYFGDSIFKNP